MRNVAVELGERSYDILIGHDWLEQLGEQVRKRLDPSQVMVVSDETVAGLYAAPALASLRQSGLRLELATFPAGEPSKCLAVYSRLLDAVADAGLDRKSALVALGGGVTGDLGGFVAACYMRGIAYVQVPTTLLSMADSSVGGKTGIDHARGKNLIGAFHQPRLVFVDTATLKTLPTVEFRSGMAEVIKHGVIRDADFFAFLEQSVEPIMRCEQSVMERLVARNCEIKAAVVSADEREAGLRAILNFGHTAAHAIETLTGYEGYRHGEAVSIGMMVAGVVARELCGFSVTDSRRLAELLSEVDLPTTVPDHPALDTQAIVSAMYGDKKAERGALRYVLPSKIGQVDVVKILDDTVVKRAIDACRGC